MDPYHKNNVSDDQVRETREMTYKGYIQAWLNGMAVQVFDASLGVWTDVAETAS